LLTTCPPEYTLVPYTSLFRSRHAARRERGLECNIAAPDANEIRQGRDDVDVRIPIGSLQAKLAPPVLVQEPPTALSRRLIDELRSEEHTSALQSREKLVCRLL